VPLLTYPALTTGVIEIDFDNVIVFVPVLIDALVPVTVLGPEALPSATALIL